MTLIDHRKIVDDLKARKAIADVSVEREYGEKLGAFEEKWESVLEEG